MIGMPAQAPTSKPASIGRFTARTESSATYCAAVPNRRPNWAWYTQTFSPMRFASTPSPTASITPAPSLLGMT